MAYKPTDTYIPCNNNGFIVEAYTKSYKFYIDNPKYPEDRSVNGIIWIVDIEAMSKVDLNSAQISLKFLNVFNNSQIFKS